MNVGIKVLYNICISVSSINIMNAAYNSYIIMTLKVFIVVGGDGDGVWVACQ